MIFARIRLDRLRADRDRRQAESAEDRAESAAPDEARRIVAGGEAGEGDAARSRSACAQRRAGIETCGL